MLRRWLVVFASGLLVAACGGKSSGNGTSSGGSAGSGGQGAGGSSGSGGACPDYSPPSAGSTSCRSDTECSFLSAVCVAPGETPPSCGVCGPPSNDCSQGSPCPSGEVCEQYSGQCCSGASCVPKCTATSCPADQQCTPSGLCQPTPCTAGYTCPSEWRCAPAAPGADAHGCEAIPCSEGYKCPENTRCGSQAGANHGCEALKCTSDSDCDCGACVNNRCAAGPGTCYELPA